MQSMTSNLRTLFTLMATAWAVTPLAGQTVSPSSAPAARYPEWKLTWSDEFDGGSVDQEKWQFQTGQHGWGNKEWQNYTKGDNVTVRNGILRITAEKTGPGQQAGDYTSGRLKSKKSFRYGRMEVRQDARPQREGAVAGDLDVG